MVNNEIAAVMVVGVGGVMSGQTFESGDTQAHPQNMLSPWRWLQKVKSLAS